MLRLYSPQGYLLRFTPGKQAAPEDIFVGLRTKSKCSSESGKRLPFWEDDWDGCGESTHCKEETAFTTFLCSVPPCKHVPYFCGFTTLSGVGETNHMPSSLSVLN